jgi:perosamine synthetase
MIPVNSIKFSGNEKKYLCQCIDDGWISSEGPFVKEFENRMANFHSKKHAIAVSNGSAALEIAIQALQLGPDDEVILPTFTIISCLLAVIKTGAKPILVDSDPATWNMSASEVLKKINSKTKAIMIVHIYGLPVDMHEILEVARKKNITVIEDCAELLGQKYNDNVVGSFGDIATFSFYANKNVTSGEGGMIACNNDAIAKRCQSLRNLCFEAGRRFIHNEIGWNYRMSNLQAAVGLAQFEQLEDKLSTKIEIAKKYTKKLSKNTFLQLPLEKTNYGENIYWVYGLVLKDLVKFDALEAMERLKKQSIETRPFFWCMHEQPLAKKLNLFHGESYPHAEKLARRGFYIPFGCGLTEEQQTIVVEALNGLFN